MKKKIKDGLFLFWFFFKVGWYTFGGGWSILAQLEREFVDKRPWITGEDLLDMIAMSKTVPGLMVANLCMMFGYSVAGTFGGICCVCGMAFPAIIVMTLVTAFYDRVKDNRICYAIMCGIRSSVVPIMIGAMWPMAQTACKKKSGMIICILAMSVQFLTGISSALLIMVSVAAALLYWGGRKLWKC